MNLASNIKKKKTVFKVRVMPGRVNRYGWSVQKWFVGAVNLTNNYNILGGSINGGTPIAGWFIS